MANWSLKDWLESLAYLVAILAPTIAGVAYLIGRRTRDIAALTTDLARPWTNEGDIVSDEPVFLHLYLDLTAGDLIGSLTSSTHDRSLEAHVTVRWRHAVLVITELAGRSLLPVAIVKLTLVGNRNRLDWKLKRVHQPYELPKRTLLWPDSSAKLHLL